MFLTNCCVTAVWSLNVTSFFVFYITIWLHKCEYSYFFKTKIISICNINVCKRSHFCEQQTLPVATKAQFTYYNIFVLCFYSKSYVAQWMSLSFDILL